MNLASEALRLLLGRSCRNCKYCFKPTTRLVILGSVAENKKDLLSGMYCNYKNIAIYRPQGMEMPISDVVDEDKYCEKWVLKA